MPFQSPLRTVHCFCEGAVFGGDCLVVADDLADDEVQKLLREIGIEIGVVGEAPEPGNLLGLARRIGGRQPVGSLEMADGLRAAGNARPACE